jgi:hypothetical protein
MMEAAEVPRRNLNRGVPAISGCWRKSHYNAVLCGIVDHFLQFATASFQVGDFARVFPIVNFHAAQLNLHEVNQGLERPFGYGHDGSPPVLSHVKQIMVVPLPPPPSSLPPAVAEASLGAAFM